MSQLYTEVRPIVFVLGKPGSGKGTACDIATRSLNIKHFSAGQLLRDEVAKAISPNKEEILADMKAGRIVRPEITVALLRQAMQEYPKVLAFMIDGFPREVPQLEFFNQQIVCEKLYVLELRCGEECCRERIFGRNSGRLDDNEDTLRVRLQNFQEETTHVLDIFEKKNKLIVVNSEASKDEVGKEVLKKMQELLQ